MPVKPVFPPRQPCQKLTAAPSGTPGAFRGLVLEPASHAGIVITHPRDMVTGPRLARAGMGDITPSQVHTNRLVWDGRCVHRDMELDMHRVGAIAILTQLRGFRLASF